MDSFEFVQILIAIVLGFGISEILAGWGHQLRHRANRGFSGLQLAASGYVLAWSFRYLWIQWGTRPETWDYVAYLMSAAPAVLLALAAHAVRFDPALEEHDAHAQYEQSRRPVGVLLAVFPAVVLARSFYNYGQLLNDPWLVSVVFGGTTLAFLWIAATSRPRSQWIAWSVVWGLHLVLWTRFFQTLSPSAS